MLNKASNGKRIGACVLDGLFIWIIMLVAFLISDNLGFLVSMFISVLYFGLSEGSKLGGTPGKYLCGLMVVDTQGNPLTYKKSFIRSLCRILSGMILGIGYIVGLFDADGKTLHDRMAGTMVVVRTPTQKKDIFGGNAQPKLTAISGPFAGRSFLIPEQGIVIGRSRTQCSLVFPEGDEGQGISRVHCKIQFDSHKQMFILYDMGSSYGTFLGNGTRVWQGQPTFLRVGEEFYMAMPTIRFRGEISPVRRT